ncbi:MAG: hypothetical protein KDI83_19190 [Gammaproteobacteria bacterium]|nr:hypothetical protein [Gammaproteobacteria bacterium]
MRTGYRYIMRDQVENPIPGIMDQRVTHRGRQSEKLMSMLSVAFVTFVYLLAMALSTD